MKFWLRRGIEEARLEATAMIAGSRLIASNNVVKMRDGYTIIRITLRCELLRMMGWRSRIDTSRQTIVGKA